MIGTTLIKRYRVDSEIGQGGMGTVYRGFDTLLERPVAIKVLSYSGMGTEGRGKLVNEAQTAAKLNHPNIVAVYDVGQDEKIPFIVMEFVEGHSLVEAKPDELPQTLEIIRQVCLGLDHAHSLGIIHRDLKPENVVITNDGIAKLMDFGLARSIASRYTMEGMVEGTVFYLAPEQALGQEIDQRADLYSLGVMMYELTTGELPFVDQDPIAIISQHLHAPVVPPRAKNEEIPRSLNELIINLLNKDPRDRPASAREVLQTLEAIDFGYLEADQVEELSLLDRIVRGRMVGRERELNQARQLWMNAKSGQGQLLLISGEPGIGKTRLMREIATQAEVSGGQVYVGECQPEGNAPYAPFAQITRRALRANQDNGFTFPKHVMADLLMLSPELNVDYPDVSQNPKLDPEAEQRRLFDNILRFCNILSSNAPVLLVLEDIHWADSGSLHMLESLVARARQLPVMLLGTYREVELDEALPLHETLLGLARKRLGRRLKLDRLDRDATRDLLGIIFAEEITGEFLEGIYKETEGNPFFVEEVSKALVESGQVWFEGGQWHRSPDMAELSIPQGVKVAIQSRVSKLDQDTQSILLPAAVIGREFDFETLNKVAGIDEDRLITCLEEAINKQLIEELKGGGGELFQFSHALIPAAIRENISGLRRTRLHRQVAAAIEQLNPDEYERLAYHWGEAGDEEKGLAYTIQAADRARQAYANQDAIRLYSEALALLPEDHPERFDLLAGRAAVYNVMAQREAQLADIQAMIRLADEEGDQRRKVDGLIGLAVLYLDTETEKARQPLEQALALAQEFGDGAREGRALYNLGRQAFIFNEGYDAREYFKTSAASLRQAGFVGESAESMSFLSVVLGNLGDRPASLEAAQQAADLSKESGDKLLEALTTRRLAIAYWSQYQDAQALPIAETALRMFREIGDLHNEVHALNVLGLIKNNLGQLAESEADFLEGLQIAESINNDVGIRWVLINISDVYNWSAGQYAKIIQLIDEQQDKALKVENENLYLYLQLSKALALLRLGQYDEGFNLLEVSLPRFNALDDLSQGWALCTMAQYSAELGEFEQSFHYIEMAEELSSKFQDPYGRSYLNFFSAEVSILGGDISRIQKVVEEISKDLPALEQRGDKAELGDQLYVKAKLHLALSGEDQHQAQTALECITEALECYQFRLSSFVMPEQVHFLHSRALRLNGLDDQADEALLKAYQRVMMVAGNIPDQDLQRSYLENVRENRDIQSQYLERFGD